MSCFGSQTDFRHTSAFSPFGAQSRKCFLPARSGRWQAQGRVSSKQALYAKNASFQTQPRPYSLWPFSGSCYVCVQCPSIIPGAPDDYYIVINHYGRFGAAFAETDLDRANYETTVADLISGQHCDPLRVIMFNPETNRSEDVSHAIAQEILRRLGLEGRSVPLALEDFIDRHVGRDRQLTLRLAVAE